MKLVSSIIFCFMKIEKKAMLGLWISSQHKVGKASWETAL
jgi:hypothetical protein